MNRPIKFRIWDIEKNNFASFTDKDIYTEHYFKVGKELNLNRLLGGEYIIQQFVGLKDAVDAEIYEGDILKSQDGQKFTVKYIDGSFVISIDEQNYHTLAESLIKSWNLCILSNIFEEFDLNKGIVLISPGKDDKISFTEFLSPGKKKTITVSMDTLKRIVKPICQT
jgi:hypothetical protein